MLRRTGAVPPDHDPLVVAWVSTPADLENDPLTGHLLPRIFEAQGVGRALREDRVEAPEWDRERHSWLRSLRDLADAGRLDRDLLVDGCVRRFLLGGDAADLRFFVRLYDLLDPPRARNAPATTCGCCPPRRDRWPSWRCGSCAAPVPWTGRPVG
nr:hypothetical protein GCM10020093_028340 [Planobispora longispora]